MTINNIAVWNRALLRLFAWVAIKQAAYNRKRMVEYTAIDADVPVVQMKSHEKRNRTIIVRGNVHLESRLVTDASWFFAKVGKEFASHETVFQGNREYARGDVTTNTVEGFFSIFKRGMRGVYQFCGEKHLHRYLAEFDFRYSNRIALGYNDADRADTLLKGVSGKRLTYQQTGAR